MAYIVANPTFSGTVTLSNGPLILPASQGIQIPDGAPGVTTNKVYAVGGALYFNGTLLASGGGMTNPMTTANDLILGGASGAPTRLAKGSDTQILGVASGTVGYYNSAIFGIAQEFTPEQYGALGNGSNDDADAIEAADAAANALASSLLRSGGIVRYTSGKVYYCSRAITIRANCYGVGAELLFPNDFTGTAVSIGTAGTEAIENRIMWLPSVICTRTSYLNWNATPNSIGIQANGTQYCEIHVTGIRNFAKGLRLFASSGYYVGYNSFYLGMLLDNKSQINIENGDTNAQSWVNENRFYNGRLSQSSNFGANIPDARSIYIKQYATPGAITTTQTMSLNSTTKVITWTGGDFTAAGFYVGGYAVMSGWANGASNGTFRVIAVGTTTLTLAANVTLGANETNKASVTIAMEGASFGSIPNNNNFYGVSMESDVAEAMVHILGGTLNNFFGCRFERTASTTIFIFGMHSSLAVGQRNNFYGGYTNAGTDLVLTQNSWANQNMAMMNGRIAAGSSNAYGTIQLANYATDTNPVICIWGNAAQDSTLFKPTGTTWLGQIGSYYWDLKAAANALPRIRLASNNGALYFGDGTTTLGPYLTALGANTGISLVNGIFSTPGITLSAATNGIVIPTGAPTSTTNALYQVGGSLYFNGSQVGGGAATGVTDITYAATININLTTITTPVARITLTGPCTINFTGGSDGQKLTLELLQDGTGGRVVTLGTGIGYGADILSYSGNTTLNKRDILGFQYNSSLSKALLIAVAKGY